MLPITSESSSSAADQYRSSCIRLNTHCNSSLVNSLSVHGQSLHDIKHLDFSANHFGRRGIRPILQTVLTLCPNVESLNLSSNALCNDNVQELYELLMPRGKGEKEFCPKLQFLDVSKNPISSYGGKLLSRLVEMRPQLRRIDADGTLMNPGLLRVVQAKCARKSPRYDGLRALSAVLGDTRGQQPSVLASHNNVHDDVEAAAIAEETAVASASCSTGTPAPAVSTASPTSVTRKTSAGGGVKSAGEDVSNTPRDEWSAMETIWNLAAVAAPPEDGWTGLAAVMALVRHDVSIASMY